VEGDCITILGVFYGGRNYEAALIEEEDESGQMAANFENCGHAWNGGGMLAGRVVFCGGEFPDSCGRNAL
jgi:hypothetical protein